MFSTIYRGEGGCNAMWHLIRSLLPTVPLLLKFVLNQVDCSHFWIFSVSVDGEGGTAEIKEASVGK